MDYQIVEEEHIRREKEKGRFGIGGEVVRCWIEIFKWSGDSF